MKQFTNVITLFQNFSLDSIVQSIQIPSEDVIQMFIKEETVCSPQSEAKTLPTCVIVTSYGIYECRQKLVDTTVH